MFNKLFGNNNNFSDESKTNIIEDAMAIRQTVDYIILRAAWDEYTSIKSRDPDYRYGDATPTPAWQALEKIEEYDGVLDDFTDEEQNLLRALKKGFMIYSDVLHVLIDHHDDVRAGEEVIEKYPQLKEAVPEEYFNPLQIIEVLVEVVKDYQWQLEHFSLKHEDAIEKSIRIQSENNLV